MRFPDSPQGRKFFPKCCDRIVAIEKSGKINLRQTLFFIAKELDHQNRVLHCERC
jgi:hypothetical protein